jgi:lysophospholipase L1-like esterase
VAEVVANSVARIYRKVNGEPVLIGSYPSAPLVLDTKAKLDASISQASGARAALAPSQRWVNGLGFVIGEQYAEIPDPRPITDARRRIVNRLGFVSAEEDVDGRQRIIGGWTRPILDAQYRLVNPLGFISQMIDVDGTARLPGTISRPITWARHIRSNPLGFLTFVEDLAGRSSTSNAEASASAPLPIATDARSLSLWRAKLATLMQTGSGKARLLITGDSWTEKRPIPQQLANLLRAEFGDAGGGWIACSAYKTSSSDDLGPIDSATLAVSGWTLFDISASEVLPDCGCGHDGQALHTTGSVATAIATFTGTDVSLFRPKSTGSLRYRIDGGAWTTLTGDGSNTLEVTTIGGLSNGTHTLSIDTAPNTGGGIAALYGIRFATAGATGVEILKCGNSGQDATQLGVYVATHVTAPIAEIQPDLIIFILGTNDYRRAGRTPDNFATVLSDYVTAARAGAPQVGFLFAAPADTDGSAVEPLTAYRDAMAAFAIAGRHAFYNMHDDWADWETEDSRGQWLDSLHVNTVGGYRIAASLIRHFLKI